jgi:hypothetical protein
MMHLLCVCVALFYFVICLYVHRGREGGIVSPSFSMEYIEIKLNNKQLEMASKRVTVVNYKNNSGLFW